MRTDRPSKAAMQRWLVLTQYYAPELGAPQIRLRALVRELRRRGFTVEVLTGMPNYPEGRIRPGYRGRLAARESIDGTPVQRVWLYAATGRSAAARLANYLSFTCTAFVAAFFLRRPDVVFLESQPLSLGAVALAMRALRGVPYICNVPDLQVEVAGQMGFLRSGRLLRLAARFETLLLRRAWKVSTVTRGFIEHFRAKGIEDRKLTFLPNGADTEFLKPQSPSAVLRQRWGLGDRKIFAYVGTHAFYHGLETVIEAARRLSHRTDIAFLFVGAGPERERLREMARELPNVIFGDSPYEEMADLYSISYASIASLRNIEVAEGMRLSKIFPALSCGVPVIYSGRGEAADLLGKFDCGVTVDPEDPAALAEAVERLADDSGRRSRMGENGRRFVVENYSWSGIIERWLAEAGIAEGSLVIGPSPAETADDEPVPVRSAAAVGRAFPENEQRSTAADR